MKLRVALSLLLLFAAPACAAQLRHIVIIGDSLQSGTGVERVRDVASVRLARYTGAMVHNLASPGATLSDLAPTYPGLRALTPAIALLNGFFRQLSVVIIALGTNDWVVGVPVATYEATYGTMLDELPANVTKICLGPPWVVNETNVNTAGSVLAEYREAARRACETHGGIYLDGAAAIPHTLAYFLDGLHPNAAGHRMMARFLSQALRERGLVP